MTPVVLVHWARRGAGPEPVGVWSIIDEEQQSFYSAGNEAFEQRGVKAEGTNGSQFFITMDADSGDLWPLR